MPKLPLWFLLLGLLSSLSGCWVNLEDVTIQEATFAAATGGTLSAGCDVTHLISADSGTMTEDQCLQFLQLQTHIDPTDPTQTIVDHYAAIIVPLTDFENIKETLNIACRDLGSHCTFAIAITNMNTMIVKARNAH